MESGNKNSRQLKTAINVKELVYIRDIAPAVYFPYTQNTFILLVRHGRIDYVETVL